MYKWKESQGDSVASISVLKGNEKSKKWKNLTVIIISFVSLSILTTVTASFGEVEYNEPFVNNIDSDSFSEISRQSDPLAVERGFSADINNLWNVVSAEEEPNEPSVNYIGSDSFSDISRSNESESDIPLLTP